MDVQFLSHKHRKKNGSPCCHLEAVCANLCAPCIWMVGGCGRPRGLDAITRTRHAAAEITKNRHPRVQIRRWVPSRRRGDGVVTCEGPRVLRMVSFSAAFRVHLNPSWERFTPPMMDLVYSGGPSRSIPARPDERHQVSRGPDSRPLKTRTGHVFTLACLPLTRSDLSPAGVSSRCVEAWRFRSITGQLC